MTKVSGLGGLATVLAIAMGVFVSAKGPTLKVTIEGPGLAQPVELTSGKAIAPNIWMGDFFEGLAAEPPTRLPRYHVSFYAMSTEGVKVMYGVTYVHDDATGEGFVYLPGRGEDGYRLNVGTIIR